MSASFATTLRRLIALVFVLAVLTLLLSIPALLDPAAAQTPAPTVTPTPTDAELLGVETWIDRGQQWVERFGWLGAFLALLIGGILFLLSGYGEGIREAWKERGKKAGDKPFEALEQQEARQTEARERKSGTEIYLEWLRTEESLCYLPIIPIEQRQDQLLLEEVYVPLRVVEREQIEGFRKLMLGEFDPAGEYRLRAEALEALERSQRVYRLLSDADALSIDDLASKDNQWEEDEDETPPAVTTKRLLLIGDAGSGKTTTLHYGALALARDYLAQTTEAAQTSLDLYADRPLLPFYIRLTLVASFVREKFQRASAEELPALDLAPESLLLEWLDGYVYEQTSKQIPRALPSACIKQGGCLVLLDGLDETGDARERDYMQRLIVNLAQADRANRNRYLVASRPFDGLHLLSFNDYHLSPLNQDEIELLLNNWFTAMRKQETTHRRTSEQRDDRVAYLLTTLNDNPRLFEMATNPLLLTTMALLVHSGTTLPRERAELYNRLVPLLIKQWREGQVSGGKPPGHQSGPQLLYAESETGVQRRLQELAAWMQEQQRREIRLHEAQDVLRPIYRDLMRAQGWNDEQCDDHISRLLGSLELHSGLVQGRDRGYSFAHYTLQEYLTARAYDRRRDGVERLLTRRDQARWRETILLAVGHWATVGPPEKAQDLLDALLQSAETAAVLLAAAALDDADAPRVPELADLYQHATTRLRAIAFDPVHCPDPRTRNQAAELLDRLGADARPELDPADARYWAARIEPGPFEMGDDNGRRDNEKPAFTCHIHRPYALARFPVTNRQYAQFLEDLEPEEFAKRRPRYWPGQSYRAGEGNHPVVGVTWADACAFAAWANDRFLTEEQRAQGEQIRLPTEPEWERAAAYPVVLPAGDPGAGKREYPWGALTNTTNDGIKGNIPMNARETGIGDTSVVGIFPHGAAACGAEELAGNVWEWCSTPYQNYPLPEDLQAESLYTTEVYQGRTYVLRGGSWFNNPSNARCVARYVISPLYLNDDSGLRLAHSFSSL